MTDRKREEIASLEKELAKLRSESEKLTALIRMTGEMIFEYDIAADHMTYRSPGEGLLFATQITENYVQNLESTNLIEQKDAEVKLVHALTSGAPSFEIELRRKSKGNKWRWVQVVGQTSYDENGNPAQVLGKVCDIDDRKKREIALEEQSMVDSLTGLLNHQAVKDGIRGRLKELKEGHEAFLIVLDVDDFKQINDTNGHLYGDAVLCSFADELRILFPNVIKGRIGGDEFLFLVDDLDRAELERRLTRLNGAMSDRFDDDKIGMHISCSLGVAATDGTVTDYDILFQWADAALYQMKSMEKGSYYILDALEGVELPGKSYLTSEENLVDQSKHLEAKIRTAEELALFCGELIDNVPNITSAFKMVCERTCSFLAIDDMVIVETTGAEARVIYQWSSWERQDFAKRINEPGVFDWETIVSRTDDFGVVIYREDDGIEKENAKSVMVVMSKDMGEQHAAVVFSRRVEDSDWQEDREILLRIARQIFGRMKFNESVEMQQRELNRKLNFDALTGLPVYSRFVDMVEEYMTGHGKSGLVFVSSDFSNFQYLNEMYGYEVGDRILHDFAVDLEEHCPEGILFCRVTADQFVGLMRSESIEQARNDYLEFTTDFVQRVNNRYDQCNLVIASGMYGVKENDWAVAPMMDNANEARKRCKLQKVTSAVEVYTEAVRKSMQNTRTVVSSMVSAYNNGEFRAWLQPKVSLKTGKIVGAEALVRWERPDGSLLMPGQFIEILERNGFITRVDFAVYDQVLSYLRNAMDAGEEVVPISVNFSRRHNEFTGFVPSILKRLRKLQIPGELIEVEVTESVFLSDLTTLTSNIKTLRDHGLEISVDDFGSGYSSLNLLSKVAVDTVKLDKQFLDDTMNSEREETALTIIKYLTKMLKHLGFKVLAEGVETKEQLEMLKLADCDIVQGYYYAKPMRIEEFRTFLREFNEMQDAAGGGLA